MSFPESPKPSAPAFDAVPVDERQVIQRHSRSFSLASRLLPRGVRDDVRKLYAWCRWCDDAVDSAADPDQARQQLSRLRADVLLIYRGEKPIHPASHWLAELVDRHDIDRQYPLALLDGMEMDLDLEQIRSENRLLSYCYHAAGVVGLMMCKLFGVTDRRALRHAKSLGIAMQLTNIARDVREDRERGRCYLPETWLNADGSPPSEDQVRLAVRRILDLADRHYEIGSQGFAYLPAKVRGAIRVAAAVYREIGNEIRRRDYRVLDGRIATSKTRFLLTAIAAWACGAGQDLQHRFAVAATKRPDHLPSFPAPTESMMNDAKYLVYLGISLTAFMGSAAFLLVTLNPKDASYSTLPLVYSAACLVVGIMTNLLAKNAESPVPIPVEETDRSEHSASTT